MTDKLHLKVVSPERVLYSKEVLEVEIPGQEGDFGILPNHEAFISILASGLLTARTTDRVEYIFIGGGFANVTDNVCTVLSEEVEFVETFDEETLEKAIYEAQENAKVARDEEERLNLQSEEHLSRAKLEIYRRLRKRSF